ncbi:MAG: glutamate racemase [Christensenellales bacterium]|jgi:glutamate racemase
MNKPIGVFDSGAGGISVLRQARARLPQEHFLFYGDDANAPYGDKPPDTIRQLTVAVMEHLMAQGVKAVLVACNTATALAVDLLRARFPVPVVAMEPAVKPALAVRPGGRVLVMATRATVDSPRFHELVYNRMHADDRVELLACPGFVELVESGQIDGARAQAVVDRCTEGVAAPDAIVLGCTHYPFLKPLIRHRFPGVPFFDGIAGTVEQLARQLARYELANTQGEGSVTLTTSGDAERVLPLYRRLLELPGVEA